MFHLDRDARFDAGYCWQDVVECQLGRSSGTSCREHFPQPPGPVAIVALGEDLAADQDHVAVVGQVHSMGL